MLSHSGLIVALALGLLTAPQPVVVDTRVLEMQIWPSMSKDACDEWQEVDHRTSCRLCHAEELLVMGVAAEWVGEWRKGIGPSLGPVREYWIPGDRFGDLLGILVQRYGPPRFSRPTVRARRLATGVVAAGLVEYGAYWDIEEGGRRYHVILDGKAIRGAEMPCQPPRMKFPYYRLVVEMVPQEAE